MTDTFENQPTYKPWDLWLMRNCADCSVEGCNTYQRNYALAQTWHKDFTHEPDCPHKVKISHNCNADCHCSYCTGERK